MNWFKNATTRVKLLASFALQMGLVVAVLVTAYLGIKSVLQRQAHLFEVDFFLLGLKGFISFCLVSSAVYILNDIFDKLDSPVPCSFISKGRHSARHREVIVYCLWHMDNCNPSFCLFFYPPCHIESSFSADCYKVSDIEGLKG